MFKQLFVFFLIVALFGNSMQIEYGFGESVDKAVEGAGNNFNVGKWPGIQFNFGSNGGGEGGASEGGASKGGASEGGSGSGGAKKGGAAYK